MTYTNCGLDLLVSEESPSSFTFKYCKVYKEVSMCLKYKIKIKVFYNKQNKMFLCHI